MATDFTEKNYVDPTSVARLAQQQAQAQAQQAQQGYQDKMQAIQQIAGSVSKMVSTSVEASKQRQKDDMVKNLANSMAARVPNVMAPQQGPSQPTMAPQGAVSQLSSQFPDATGQAYQQNAAAPLPPVSTPDINTQNAVRSSVVTNPAPWTKQLADQLIQSPAEQAQTAMNTQKAAQEQANAMKLNQPIQPSTLSLIKAAHTKLGLPPPDPAEFSNMKEQDAQTYLGNATKLNNQSANAQQGRVEIMKQNTIAKLHAGFSKDMNPSNWGPNSLAGKSAALTANADSAINLADQMLGGNIPTTEQTMTSLALDANRVLTQSGVPSEKTTAELKAKTGFASFAAAIQYFSGHPEDQKLQPFVKLLRTEVQRQRDQRQNIVDTTLKKNLAKYNQLRQLDPDGWEQEVTAAGFDPELAKKGRLQLAQGGNSTMYGGNIGDTSGGFAQNAAPQDDPQVHALAGLLGLKKKGSK